MSDIPIVERAGDDVIARLGEQPISIAQFCADIAAVADALPDTSFVANLCQDRYTFSVCFFAALTRRQTNLLPGRREPQAATQLRADYPACAIVSDRDSAGIDALIELQAGCNGTMASAACPGEHDAAIVFTSGSTGVPQAHHKSWRMLATWRSVHQRYLPGVPDLPRGMVATVPSWHMYGLEWAMLLPTVAPLTLYCGADFYPQDVAAALAGFEQPSILVSTPVHLRALRKLEQPPANVETVMSATAPLDATLIQQIETTLHTQLYEIYGCSEVGSLAYRYPGRNPAWQFFDCFDVQFQGGEITINHPELPAAVTLADQFRPVHSNLFVLEGRNTDIVKIGGKRESLANLNNVLLGIAGVEDGVIYDPGQFGAVETGRLAALVVAPELDNNGLRKALAGQLDTAFIPRPIRFVTHLPRDRTSKLKHAELRELIRSA